MARDTIASLRAELDALRASMTAAPSAPTEANAHWKARDIACSAPKPCARTFRTVKGRDWHIKNVKHA